MDISQLPNDILVHIAGFITLNDLINVHRTCKTMVHVGNNNHLWYVIIIYYMRTEYIH